MQNIKESKSLIQPPYVITRKLNIEAFLKDKNISEDINIRTSRFEQSVYQFGKEGYSKGKPSTFYAVVDIVIEPNDLLLEELTLSATGFCGDLKKFKVINKDGTIIRYNCNNVASDVLNINEKIKKIYNVGSTRLNMEFESLFFPKKYKAIYFHILLTFENVKADPNYKEEEVVARTTCPPPCHIGVPYGAPVEMCLTSCGINSC